MTKRRAFTLIEILLAITVIAVFFGLIFAFYKNAINKSKYVEAVATVANIAKTEEIAKLETGEYVAAANTQEVNERLGMDIEPRWFNYKVVGVTNDNFIVLAERIRDDIESGDLAGDDIVVARDNTGPISPDSVNQSPTDLGGDDIGGNDTGDSAPPGSSSPGSGGPSSGSPGGGSPGGDSGDSGDSSPTGGGDDDRQVYNNSIDDLLNILDRSTLGHDYYTYLQDNDVNVAFVDLDPYGALGLFVPTWWFDVFPVTGGGLTGLDTNTIYLDDSYMREFSPEAAAAVLMHEATHSYWDGNVDELADYEVDYYNNTFVNDYTPEELAAAGYPASIAEADLFWATYQEGPQAGNPYLDPDGNPVLFDTVIQEMSCFTNEAQFWNEQKGLKPSLSDDEMDAIAGYYNSGNLFPVVWLNYWNYSLYEVPVRLN